LGGYGNGAGDYIGVFEEIAAHNEPGYNNEYDANAPADDPTGRATQNFLYGWAFEFYRICFFTHIILQKAEGRKQKANCFKN
jgi:hypothetical protein